MIPDSIERSHLLKAITSAIRNGIPPNRQSTKYDLFHDNRKFPAKYIISLAHTFVDGRELPSNEFSGGREANNFLLSLSFTVIDKKGRQVSRT